jgi:hypothetical protein
MIDPCKKLHLRNGRAIRNLVIGQSFPYAISGQARLAGGTWEEAQWTREGHFSLTPDHVYPCGDPYDLVEDTDD